MRKDSNFEEFHGPGWPEPRQLERYFLGPPEQRWPIEDSGDCYGFNALGVEGTEHLPEGKGRIDIRLTLAGNRYHGVLFYYRKYGGGNAISLYSKGNLKRLREWVETIDGDKLSVGLFIPLETAWKALKEFLERDGALPECIEWIPSDLADRYTSLDKYFVPDPHKV
jgi:hypothetical protein